MQVGMSGDEIGCVMAIFDILTAWFIRLCDSIWAKKKLDTKEAPDEEVVV